MEGKNDHQNQMSHCSVENKCVGLVCGFGFKFEARSDLFAEDYTGNHFH